LRNGAGTARLCEHQQVSRCGAGAFRGIDSAICAAIAVDALGPERVWCVMMPSAYTSAESLEDAAGCAAMLGVRLDTIPIVPAVDAFAEMLAPAFAGRQPDLAEENLQSRIRGTTLMALSNKFGPMLVTTGNKSEMSVGYATIYGDMNGGYNPLKDAYKTTVFAISQWRNAARPKIGLGPKGIGHRRAHHHQAAKCRTAPGSEGFRFAARIRGARCDSARPGRARKERRPGGGRRFRPGDCRCGSSGF